MTKPKPSQVVIDFMSTIVSIVGWGFTLIGSCFCLLARSLWFVGSNFNKLMLGKDSNSESDAKSV